MLSEPTTPTWFTTPPKNSPAVAGGTGEVEKISQCWGEDGSSMSMPSPFKSSSIPPPPLLVTLSLMVDLWAGEIGRNFAFLLQPFAAAGGVPWAALATGPDISVGFIEDLSVQILFNFTMNFVNNPSLLIRFKISNKKDLNF